MGAQGAARSSSVDLRGGAILAGFRRLPHIVVPAAGPGQPYRSPVGGGSTRLPNRDRLRHANELRSQYDRARDAALEWLRGRDWDRATRGKAGIYLEILTAAFVPDAFEDLTRGIELVSAMPDSDRPGVTRVTIFIPQDKLHLFSDKIDKYRDADTPDGKPRYQNFAARVDDIRFRAPIQALWTDTTSRFPSSNEPFWWEVWLREGCDLDFAAIATDLELQSKTGILTFPYRTVRVVRATPEQMAKAILDSGAVAELRKALSSPSGFFAHDVERQFATVSELLERVVYPEASAPVVCILDSGVNNAHPLLAPAAATPLTYLSSWGTHDGVVHGHGTQMAGLALFGDLTPTLTSNDPIVVTHRFESVKILPDDDIDQPDIEFFAQVFRDSIRIVESTTAHRQRVFVSAITDENEAWKGAPGSWSAQIDADCAQRGDERLILISAGNIDSSPTIFAADYLNNANDTTGILEPAQAWNALTIGAYTDLIEISELAYADYSALAARGALCPQSRTSVLWEPQWPVKPDVVFEGGNYAQAPDSENATLIDDLMVLTTNSEFRETPLATFGLTSGAAALAANTCGQLRAQYPRFWPETIRGLVAHSAEWTQAMLQGLGPLEQDRRRLLGRYGYGVPNLARALWSLQHDLTMVIEDSIQPFVWRDGAAKNNQMILHQLPWPKAVLEPLAEMEVALRVTLSFYIEPNPARRGYKGRYLYGSHGLRFEVKKASETLDAFRLRINKLERDEQYENPGGDDEWFLKNNTRNRGSLISDIWRGRAIDLADRGAIAVYPVAGWWKNARRLGKVEERARYSLLLSLSVADDSVDIYTPITIQLGVPITTAIEIDSEDDAGG